MRCALAALLATGCLSVPLYQPEVSVSYTESGGGGTATGHRFTLHFAEGNGFHFPDALAIDGIDVLGRDPQATCSGLDETGVLISPTPRISANGSAMAVRSGLVPLLRGPAVTQVVVEWMTQLACNADRVPRGESMFTVFPDGRIVRYDLVVDPSAAQISASECACDQGDQGFTVTAYWTFARGLFRKLYVPGESGPSDLPAPTDVKTNLHTICLEGDAYVASAWHVAPYTTALRGSDALIAFGRDLVIGASMLTDFRWENHSAIFIDHGGCLAALDRAREYTTPSPLTVNGRAWMPAMRDGIYGGDDGVQALGIELDAMRAELTGTVNSSFAVSLRFPAAVAELRATRELATGAWYLPQRVDDRTWLVWFAGPLSAGQTIVVEPR